MFRMINQRPSLFTSLQYAQWELSLLLCSLHAVLILGFISPIEKALCLCHYGFFLLWQPVWKTEEKISRTALALFVLAGLLWIGLLNWWLMAIWISLLFALLGGRVFATQAHSARLGYLLAAIYLLIMLMLWVIPKLFDHYHELDALSPTLGYVSLLLPLMILLTRVNRQESMQPPVLDFFYTLILFMTAMLFIFASYAIYASGHSYAQMMFEILLTIAVLLVIVSWLWTPRAGFSGLGQMMSRYLMSVGMPFEQWVKRIAELAELHGDAGDFTKAAIDEMVKLPWVTGVQWRTIGSQGFAGNKTKFAADFTFNDFHLTLFTHWRLTPAMLVHVKLLTQILGEFCEAKRRETILRQHTYMQAIYETGSRLTHDMKNIVQSMSILIGAAEQASEHDHPQLIALMKKQLPLLNQRLQRTLEKLEVPTQQGIKRTRMSTWWKKLITQHSYSAVHFAAEQMPAMEIDADLLDSIADNLLQNALEKRKLAQDICITATLGDGKDFLLEVQDTGDAIPSEIAESLFTAQVHSENGLGVGLYHAATHAAQSGYWLRLERNSSGDVAFRLGKHPATRRLSRNKKAEPQA